MGWYAASLAVALGIAVPGCRPEPAAAGPVTEVMNEDAPGTEPAPGPAPWPASPRLSLAGYRSVQERAHQSAGLAVAVAISGGGHRAANFGMGALLELEQLALPAAGTTALSEVDYISSVSGGGFAAGAYLGRLYDHLAIGKLPAAAFRLQAAFTRNGTAPPDSEDYRCRSLSRHFERGYHNVLLGHWRDGCEGWSNPVSNLLNVVKLVGFMDRGDLLETNFDARVLGAWEREHPSPGRPAVPEAESSLRLDHVFVNMTESRGVSLPIWVANGTVYENGAIFQFTPDVLRAYGVCEFVHRMKTTRLPSTERLPLAVGMKTSAAFPAVVPATTLGCDCDANGQPRRFVRLLDGGVADNLGVLTALDLLDEDRKLGGQRRRRVLIVIDAYNGQDQPFSVKKKAPALIPVGLRMTSISLDSWRGRHRQITRALAGPDTAVIFLSFDELAKADPALYARVHAVKTKFDVDLSEQEDLMHAGRAVVTLQAAALQAALTLDPPPPPPGRIAPPGGAGWDGK
jgi:predicted acylesterase/phospholipase RssA